MQGVLREWRCGPSSSGGNAAGEPTTQQPFGRGRLRPLVARTLLNNGTALPASEIRATRNRRCPRSARAEFRHGLLDRRLVRWARVPTFDSRRADRPKHREKLGRWRRVRGRSTMFRVEQFAPRPPRDHPVGLVECVDLEPVGSLDESIGCSPCPSFP